MKLEPEDCANCGVTRYTEQAMAPCSHPTTLHSWSRQARPFEGGEIREAMWPDDGTPIPDGWQRVDEARADEP